MPYTQLSPTALPSRRYSFLEKSAATGEHTGLFTELSAAAIPGRRHSFAAKTPAVSEKGAGLFTALSVMALPGMRHSFTAKEAVSVISLENVAGKMPRVGRGRIDRDDKEMLELITIIISSGVLD